MSEPAQSKGPGSVFRQSALDRLSSPEQLDRVITLTKPYDWAGAAVLALFLVAGIVWSVFGSIPTLVRGSGILIATGGRVFDALASGDGTVLEIMPKVGDTVKAGDVIARIGQSTLILQLENARAVVAERKVQLDGRRRQVEQYTASRQQNLVARRRALEDRIASAEQRAEAVERQLVAEERMFQQRLITWEKLHASRQDLAQSRQVVLDAKSQLVQIDAEEINARNADERDVQLSAERLAEAERQVAELELQLKQRSQVTSPASGRVFEYKVAVGNRVAAGAPIVSIESGVTGVQLVLYLPPDSGKQVKPNMDVRVTLSTVKREEYGTMVGIVREVSDFPATAQAMLATLGNDRLVQQFSPRGPPFAARVDLIPDKSTSTGYRWSGGLGPPTVIASGTLAEAEVTVRETAPIAFVVPLLRKLSGLDR
ncbi:MAG: NHLP bacteriocin system secretion protein [Alphaproteobacteria bacterium]|nr:NHLP bacteriocin system secretion protein [Alphaproteobacteria bacterium]